MDTFLKIFSSIKSFKKIAWIFILLTLLVIMFYPIIDTNFLYNKRILNRIEVLDKVIKIDTAKLEKDERLKKEYDSIVNEISEKEDSYVNNIFIKETRKINKIIKFIFAAWIMVLIGIIMPFVKDKEKDKRTWANIAGGVFCIAVGLLFGYFGMIMPTIINVFVNVFLYQIIIVFMVYSIATINHKN